MMLAVLQNLFLKNCPMKRKEQELTLNHLLERMFLETKVTKEKLMLKFWKTSPEKVVRIVLTLQSFWLGQKEPRSQRPIHLFFEKRIARNYSESLWTQEPLK